MSISPGDFVVIFGDGSIGLLLVQTAKAYGARKVLLVGNNPNRLARANELGADQIFDCSTDSSMQSDHRLQHPHSDADPPWHSARRRRGPEPEESRATNRGGQACRRSDRSRRASLRVRNGTASCQGRRANHRSGKPCAACGPSPMSITSPYSGSRECSEVREPAWIWIRSSCAIYRFVELLAAPVIRLRFSSACCDTHASVAGAWRETVALVEQGKIHAGAIVTHRFDGLKHFSEALELVHSRSDNVIKAVILFADEDKATTPPPEHILQIL